MSIPEILFDRSHPQAIAIRAPSRPPLAYAALREQIDYTVAALNEVGIGRNDRVATVLPNGPEAATAFLSIAAGTSFAPLNPKDKKSGFSFDLEDLKPKALIVEAGSDSPAISAATEFRIPVIYINSPKDAPAGRFFLDTQELASGAPVLGGYARDDDEVLVLHTSGTTGRPKIVPLSLDNVAASAHNISRTLSLAPGDDGLVIMPMFHIHGLMAGILAPLSEGSSIFCPPAFSPTRFFDWMKEARSTWYTGVPTMHQLILQAGSQPEFTDVISESALRFIRSSSASLPPSVLEELETVFRTVVVEAYGMTEAAHQMTSNPVDKARRKPGTVGLPAGPEVRIMGEDGAFLPSGKEGHIVIKGGNVTGGYFENPSANAKAFTNGWFDTGDIGFFNDGGYLRIVGREKEIINRGGEKIAPVEVDNVLLTHPAVAQAATFGITDRLLGEVVGAAIVFRDGQSATQQELQELALERLAKFKVPTVFAFVNDIPKGPTGKLQRNMLAKQLGLAPEEAPADAVRQAPSASPAGAVLII